MRREYNKLVRDRIPEMIVSSGATCHSVTLSEAEYRRALLEKLVEEAQEAQEAADKAHGLLIMELADIREALGALMVAYALDPAEVARIQEQRRAERGGFEQRICLLWTDQ